MYRCLMRCRSFVMNRSRRVVHYGSSLMNRRRRRLVMLRCNNFVIRNNNCMRWSLFML